MPNSKKKVGLERWVDGAKADPVSHRKRQVIEVILTAISSSKELRECFYLKGGILMGLAHGSPRQTTDLDFTTKYEPSQETVTLIKDQLNKTFPLVCADVGYPKLLLNVQKIKQQPRQVPFEKANAPALKIKVAYAERGTKSAEALQAGKCSDIIEIDVSFNEELQTAEILQIREDDEILAYGLVDLVAEKFRAILQQKIRNRNRRQDVYDINLLLEKYEFDKDSKKEIMSSFLAKCESREIEPNRNSLDDDDIRKRSKAEWGSMDIEIEKLPEFEACYRSVQTFYESWPWE